MKTTEQNTVIKKKKTYPIVPLLSMVLLTHCSSLEKSVFLGATAIGGVGAAAGGLATQDAGGALIGLGVGALIGGTMGLLAHKDQEAKAELVKVTGKRGKDWGKELPTLNAPRASCTRVGERIEGDQFIGAHVLCNIEKPAVWSSK